MRARAFGRLPGAGIGFARVLAWLVLAWLVWMLGSLGLPNGTLLALACALVVAGGAVHMRRRETPAPDPFRRRLFISTEVLFVVSFLLAVLIGGYSADVNAPTEKPMDMMLVNATLASSDIPPHDPWMSGVSVNYYYLGHHMVGHRDPPHGRRAVGGVQPRARGDLRADGDDGVRGRGHARRDRPPPGAGDPPPARRRRAGASSCSR